jgi:hypothetical protein
VVNYDIVLHNILTTRDGRDFIYALLLDCGIDVLVGIPSNKIEDFELGRRKVGIDIFNKMFYNENSLLNQMINEQKKLSNTKKGELDD